MPTSLLDSQFATPEEPAPDEQPIIVSIEPAPEVIVECIIGKLGIPTVAALSQASRPKTASPGVAQP